MTLERLFALEVEFARLLRTTGMPEVDVHTSYALQYRYDAMLRTLGRTTKADVEHLKDRLLMVGDPRDVMRASDSIKRMLGLP